MFILCLFGSWNVLHCGMILVAVALLPLQGGCGSFRLCVGYNTSFIFEVNFAEVLPVHFGYSPLSLRDFNSTAHISNVLHIH